MSQGRTGFSGIFFMDPANAILLNMKDNKVLQRLFDRDQLEREPKNYTANSLKVMKNDEKRRKQAMLMLTQRKIKTGRDFYNASMIFQHGQKVADFMRARDLAYKSMGLGHTPARWLFAAATDRFLVSQGKKQKFGTQYRMVALKNKNRKTKRYFELAPYDKRTTDVVRAKFYVPPLKQLIRDARKFTQKYS